MKRAIVDYFPHSKNMLFYYFFSEVVNLTHISQKRQEYGTDGTVAGSMFTSIVRLRPQIQIHSY